jgi:hypothetical protein
VITQAHTQLIMHAVGHMTRMSRDKREMEMGKIKLQALEMQLNAQRDMTAIQAGLFRDILHAMVNLRVDAISNGFALTMGLYADQRENSRTPSESHCCLPPESPRRLAKRISEGIRRYR